MARTPTGRSSGGDGGRGKAKAPSPPARFSPSSPFPQPDIEFVVILGPWSWDSLRLPSGFADSVEGAEPAVVYLQEHDNTRIRVQAEVWYDGDGRMFLSHGWRKFVVMYGLAQGHILLFAYFADNRELVAKIYGGKMTRRLYDHSFESSGSSSGGSGNDKSSGSSLHAVKKE